MANRGGFGVRCQNITEKTGLLTGIAAVSEDEDIMMITDQGTIIRTPASDISILSRSASGVIVMRLPGEQYVANFTVVAKEENEEIDAEDEEMTEGDTAQAENPEASEIEISEIEISEIEVPEIEE